MTKEKLELENIRYIDMYHFQMWEGKFRDYEQNGEVYIYANLSNFEYSTFAESDVRVYPYPYEDLYCADDYEIFIKNKEIENYIKETLYDAVCAKVVEMEEMIGVFNKEDKK